MKSMFGPAAAILLAGAAAASAQQAQPDTIIKDNITIKCRISKATYQSVTFTPEKGAQQTVKGSEISSIVFGDEPPSFQKAKVAEAEKRVDKAANLYEEAMKEVDG